MSEKTKDHPLVERISVMRRDLGNLLFHFTRAVPADDGFLSGKTLPKTSAFSALFEILKDGQLRGSNGCIKGGDNCICFTEAPISEIVSLFNLAKITVQGGEVPRYEPYGIAVSKKWLFKQGGRPVIYQPASEYEAPPDELKHRHVTYDPTKGIDFTWEREWRVKASALTLNPVEALIVVPTRQDAFDCMYQFADLEPEYDVEGTSGRGYVSGAFHQPKWLAVSLDIFGFNI